MYVRRNQRRWLILSCQCIPVLDVIHVSFFEADIKICLEFSNRKSF